MNRLLTITAVGLPIADQLLFSVRVETVSLADGRTFAYSQELDAAIVLVNTEEPLGVLAQMRARASHGGQVAVLYVATRAGELSLQPPFRISDMQTVLQQAAQRLNPAKLALLEGMPTPPHRVLEIAINALRESTLHQQPMRLLGFAQLDLLLYPERQQFRVGKRFAGGEPWAKSLKIYQAVMLVSAGAVDEKQLSLAMSYDILRWNLALNLSHGLLLPAIAGYSKYSFVGWPNFGSLGATRDHLRMAALLVNRPVSLAQLTELTKVPRDEAIAFLNACMLIGKLREMPAQVENISAAVPVLTSHSGVVAPTASARPSPALVTRRAQGGFVSFLSKLRAALAPGSRP